MTALTNADLDVLIERQKQIANLHRGFCASETDEIRGPATMTFREHARLAADADRSADVIARLRAELAQAAADMRERLPTPTTIAARIADRLEAAGEPRPRVDILADAVAAAIRAIPTEPQP